MCPKTRCGFRWAAGSRSARSRMWRLCYSMGGLSELRPDGPVGRRVGSLNRRLNRMPAGVGLLVAALFAVAVDSSPQPAVYLDPAAPMEKRVGDMLSRMTLEEKVSQLMSDSPAIERLGIPAYNWWNECLHGVARAGRATVFPEPIGLAATWDPRSSTRWRPPSPTRPGRSFTRSSAGGNAPSSKA